MDTTDENMPLDKIPEEPDRLQVAAEIRSFYLETSKPQATDSLPADNAVQPAPPAVTYLHPAGGTSTTCRYCGKVISTTARFCRYCGRPVEGTKKVAA